MPDISPAPLELCEAAATLIRERTGLVFTEARRPMFQRALGEAMHRVRLRHPSRYLARLVADAELLDDLIDRITVGETHFFRDPRQLAVVRDRLLPRLRADRPAGHRLRIWSAGCATGEEAYTLAILTRDFTPAPFLLGTDLSRTALAVAARAQYGRWALRGVDEAVLRQHFRMRGDRWQLDPARQAAVTFGRLNLVTDAYPSPATGVWAMDLILCRNVLIYLGHDEVQRVLRSLVGSLADGGWLVLGASDPLPSVDLPCRIEVTDAGVMLQRTDHPRRAAFPVMPSHARRMTFHETAVAEPPLVAGRRERAHSDTAAATDANPAETDSALTRLERAYAAHDYPYVTTHGPALAFEPGIGARASVLLIRAFANQGALDEADRWCIAATERHRACAELFHLRTLLLTEAGHATEAIRTARAALYIDPTLIVAHLALGRALEASGARARARRVFRRALALLEARAPDIPVPASDGEPVAALTAFARGRLAVLGDEAA